MQDCVDSCLAYGHGDLEDGILVETGFLRDLFRSLLNPVHALQR